MNNRLLLIAPGRQAGGSNLLLARVASGLRRRHGYDLTLVDFADGFTRRSWAAEGVEFDFIPYAEGARIEAGATDVLLINLLSSKTLPERLTLAPGSRFVGWCTAPQDAFKFIPPAYFFNRAGWSFKSLLLRSFFARHRARIAHLLKDASARGGVVFMDEHCLEVNERLFGPGLSPSVVPICTGEAALGPRAVSPGTGKASWVGRVTDFKTEPMIAATKALLAPGSPVREVVIIGDGSDVARAKARLAGLPVSWRGHVSPGELDRMIYSEADLIFGHATALLEGAKLGVPSLLVDGTYERVAAEKLSVEWLHRCPAGYVGKIARPEDFVGRPVPTCLAEFQADPGAIGRAVHRRWREQHHPDVITDLLARMIRQGDYTYGDFLASGATRPGWLGGLMNWAKVRVFRRIY